MSERNKLILLIYLSIGSLFVSGCTSDDPTYGRTVKSEWELSKKIDLTRSDRQTIAGINEFSHSLMTKACEISDDGEFCVSPVSVSILLSMLANGSIGECQNQIMTALGSNDIGGLNTVCQKLLHFLPCDENRSSLAIDNNFWVANHNKVPASFVSTMDTIFNAGLDYVDFSKKSTIKSINKWVSDNTNGKISGILDGDWQSYSDTEMIGANTVYFKGDWSKQFNRDSTKFEIFHGIKEDFEVPMMHRSIGAEFAYDDEVYVLKLPFEDGRNIMYLYLPADGYSMVELASYLTPEKQKALDDTAKKYKVILSMPKFRQESKIPLDRILYAMNLTALNSADMSPMGLGSMPLNVIHKTSIKVDERGAELAAVSAIEGSIANISISDNQVIIDFDSPFIYMIKNESTGAVLMAGAVTDPR